MRQKRVFDLTVLLVAHLLGFPVWVLLWTVIPLMIKLEDGRSIFFRQERAGLNGSTFIALKFRSMRTNSDGTVKITKVGALLRRCAMDELPQVWNILKGDMGFVGPRAILVKEQLEEEERDPIAQKRLWVRPGLTGMAQVYNIKKAGSSRLDYDLQYVEKVSLKLDAKLMIMSLGNTLTGKWDARNR